MSGSRTGEREKEQERALSAEEREREAAILRGAAAGVQQSTRGTRLRDTVAERAFVALAENVREYAVFLLDPDGIITFWGEGARLMKWWSREQAEGAHLRLLYPAGGSEDGTAEAHIEEAAERGEYTGEGQRVRSDGSTFWAGVTLTALRDDDGRLLGFAKVTRDFTARRAAEALLRTASETAEAARLAAESASRAKGDFLATMSHEIRTPLNAILGYHSLLEHEVAGPLTPEQKSYLERARASGSHLLTLIDEILDLSRLDAKRVRVGRAAYRISEVVKAALSLVSPQAAARKLKLLDAVSGSAAGLAYWGDEERVRQILVNLLSNAVKFTSPGGRVTVSAGAADQPPPDSGLGEGPWVYIRVEDTGYGIPADRLHAIFEPFVQADMSHTRQHGGTGLGLAISRRLIQLMGGALTVRSIVGVGSTFLLWIPAAPAESADAPAARLRPGEPVEGQTFETPSIGTLRDVADAALAELERILHTYVARVRSDPGTPSARGLSEEHLEDHLASFLADVTQTLTSIDVVSGEPDGQLRDGSAIQRLISERHGLQRARLGWSEDELRREFEILGEELAAAIRRRMPRGPNSESRRAETERALVVLAAFLRNAEHISIESHRRAGAEQGATLPGP